MDSKILREAALAYQAVYDENLRQELAEEQIWEQVESWVNSLLEEGYDLSEYTWEEMYEEYINEQGRGASVGSNPNVSQNPIAKAIRGDGPSPTMTPAQRNQARMRPGTPSAKPQVSNLGSNYRGQELAAAAKARASQVGTSRQGTAGGPTVGGNTPIGPAKTPAIKPAAKRAPTAPAAKPPTATTPAPTGGTRPAAIPSVSKVDPAKPKTPNPLMKDMPKGPGSMAAPTPAPKKFDIRDRDPRARANFDPRYDKKPINQSFDLFDVVLGHLLDEGYADTEEAALAIMANMSEQWKQSILEG